MWRQNNWRVKSQYWCDLIYGIRSLFQTTTISVPKKISRSDRWCIWRYPLLSRRLKLSNTEPGRWVTHTLIPISLQNTSRQRLPDVEPIRISASFYFLSHGWHLFHCWKASPGLKLSSNLRARGNASHLQFYGFMKVLQCWRQLLVHYYKIILHMLYMFKKQAKFICY